MRILRNKAMTGSSGYISN